MPPLSWRTVNRRIPLEGSRFQRSLSLPENLRPHKSAGLKRAYVTSSEPELQYCNMIPYCHGRLGLWSMAQSKWALGRDSNFLVMRTVLVSEADMLNADLGGEGCRFEGDIPMPKRRMEAAIRF